MKNKIIYGCCFLFILILSLVFLNLDNDTCSYNSCKTSSLNSNLSPVSQDEEDVSTDLDDNGIFSTYYKLASNYVKNLSLNEKIGQLFLVRYPESNQVELLKKYNFAGYVFYEKDFTGKTQNQVKNMINNLQNEAKTPILTAVDEEGGKVVRISSNSNLVNEPFKSSSELYNEGGFNLIKDDTIDKSKILYNLGINVNLAPVVDVSSDSNSYIYERTLKQNTAITSTYAKTVIDASKNSGVSYVLKHFPGYGNNADTHEGTSTDTRSYDDILDNDLPPFESGIDNGAEAILISHNIVTSIDPNNPASLSLNINNLLRKTLDFTGISITDDLSMGAIDGIDKPVVKAILAGNDLIMVTDFQSSIKQVQDAVNDGTISEELIEKIATRIIAWKYYKGLMFMNSK